LSRPPTNSSDLFRRPGNDRGNRITPEGRIPIQ
jgi:hypothetical protein